MRSRGFWLRWLFFFSLIIGFSVALISQPASAQKVTMRFLNSESDKDTIKFLEETFKEYQQKKGIRVVLETVAATDAYTKILASIKAKRPYEIVNVMYLGELTPLVFENQVVPMTPIIKKIGMQDFGPNILFPYKDEVWWFPYDYNFSMMAIRTDILKEKGLAVPKTWDELLKVAKACTDDTDGDGKIDRYGIVMPLGLSSTTTWASTPLFWGNGVHTFDDKWNVIIDKPEMKPKVIESLEMYKKLFQYMPPGLASADYTQLMAKFIGGKAAIFSGAGRIVHQIERFNPELIDKFDLVGWPTPDGKRTASTLGYDGWYVLKGPQQKQAMEFMEWFVTNKQIGFLKTLPIHYQPTQYSIYKNPEWRSHPSVQRFSKIVENELNLMEKGYFRSVDTDGPTPFDMRPAKIFASFLYPELLQRVLLNNENPSKAIDEIAKKMREAIK